MQVYVKGTVLRVYERPLYVDKSTGETGALTYGLQMMVDEHLKNGEIINDICDLKVSKELMEKYKGKKGQAVEVPCTTYSKSSISLTAVK